MAKLQPAGLEWVNENLRGFIKGVEEQARAVLESNTGLKEYTETVENFNKKTKEWDKSIITVTRSIDGFATSVKQTAGVVDEVGDVVTKTSDSFKATDDVTQKASSSMAIFAKGATLLATSIQLYLIGALKDLLKWVVKSVVYLATAPLRAVRDLAKLGFQALVIAAKGVVTAFKGIMEFGKNVLGVIRDVAAVAIDMGIQVGRFLVRISNEMLDAGKRIETGFAGVAKAATGVVDNLGNITEVGERVRQQFLDLAAVTPLSVEDILKIGEFGAQLNVADESLSEFARVISAVTASTILSAEMAALGFGKIAAVMGIADEDFERMGSTIVWLGNNMGIVEDDLILLAQRITGVSKIAGITTDELFGISAAILRLGATPYAGASAFTQFVTKVIPAMRLGTEEAEIFAATAGMTSEAFVEAWDQDPASTFLNFVIGLSMAGDNAIVILDELGLANIRTSQAFLSLGKSPELLMEALAGAKTAWVENTALTREAAIRYATVESQIEMLKNRVDILGDTFFQGLRPIIIEVIELGGKLAVIVGEVMVGAFAALEPFIARAAEWLSTIGEAIPTGSIEDAIRGMVGDVDIVDDIENILTLKGVDLYTFSRTGQALLADALGTLFTQSDVEQFPDAQGLFDLANTTLRTTIKKDVSNGAKGLLDIASLTLKNAIRETPIFEIAGKELAEDALGLFDLAGESLRTAIKKPIARDIDRGVQGLFDLADASLRTAIKKPVAKDIAEGLSKRTSDAFKEMFGFDVTRLTNLPPVLQKITIAAHNLLGLDMQQIIGVFDVFEGVRTMISGWFSTFNFSAVGAGITTSIGKVLDYIVKVGEEGASTWEDFTQLVLDLLGLDPALAGPLVDTIGSIIDTVTGIFSDIDFGAASASITEWANGVIQWFIDNWEPEIQPIIEGAWDWIINYDWKGLWKTVTDNGQLVIDWFVEKWPAVRDTVIGAYQDIMDFLFGPKAQVAPSTALGGKDVWERTGGFVDGLISGFDEVAAAVGRAADAIKNEIIPNLEEAILNLAIMLGMEPGATTMEAGEFVAGRISAVVDAYRELWTILSEIIAFVTGEDFQKIVKAVAFVIPGGTALKGAEISGDEGKGITGTVLTGIFGDEWWQTVAQPAVDKGLAAINGYFATWRKNVHDDAVGLEQDLVGQSIIPDMMAAIVDVFRTGLAEVGTLWSGFWTTMISGTDTSLDAFLTTMGVEGGASGGLLGAIADSLPEFFDAGEDIIGAISDGMMAASHLMVAALKSNVVAMNVAVSEGGDKGILGVLDKIGLKIVIRIKNAIIKSYQIILDALEFAMSLGGGLINQARAAANDVRNGAGEATGGAVTNAVDSAGQAQRIAQPTPYMQPPVEGPPRRYGVQGEQAAVVTVGPNYVRDDMDMVSLENTVRQVVSEEVRQ